MRVGLPEVSLGLLPAAGGTQRLTRLIGLPRALDQILNARRSNARRALRAGLVDEVVHPAALERAANDRARRGPKRKVQGGASLFDRAATWLAPLRALAFRQARSAAVKETKGHYPAPLKALEAIQIGLEKGMDAGLEAEARLFGELATSDVSRNLIALFLLGLAQRRGAAEGLPRGELPDGHRDRRRGPHGLGHRAVRRDRRRDRAHARRRHRRRRAAVSTRCASSRPTRRASASSSAARARA